MHREFQRNFTTDLCMPLIYIMQKMSAETTMQIAKYYWRYFTLYRHDVLCLLQFLHEEEIVKTSFPTGSLASQLKLILQNYSPPC